MDAYAIFGAYESMRGPELKCTECNGEACGDIEWHDGGYICQACHEKDQREEG